MNYNQKVYKESNHCFEGLCNFMIHKDVKYDVMQFAKNHLENSYGAADF